MKVQYLASSSTKSPCFEDESSDFDRFIHKKGVFCGFFVKFRAKIIG